LPLPGGLGSPGEGAESLALASVAESVAERGWGGGVFGMRKGWLLWLVVSESVVGSSVM